VYLLVFTHILLGILIFKELTAQRKSFGVKGLSSEVTQTRILLKFRQNYNRSRKFSLFTSALWISIIIFTNAGHGTCLKISHIYLVCVLIPHFSAAI
jgi:hypothetical protein